MSSRQENSRISKVSYLFDNVSLRGRTTFPPSTKAIDTRSYTAMAYRREIQVRLEASEYIFRFMTHYSRVAIHP